MDSLTRAYGVRFEEVVGAVTLATTTPMPLAVAYRGSGSVCINRPCHFFVMSRSCSVEVALFTTTAASRLRRWWRRTLARC